MPLPTADLIYSDDSPVARVALEPAHNVQHSLVLLSLSEKFSGLDDWIYHTVAAMSAEERATNDLVTIGFYYATAPRDSYPSFPAFLDELVGESPIRLRNRVLDTYIRMIEGEAIDSAGNDARYERILSDVNTFLSYLRRVFDDDHLIPEIERRAYTYLIDPPAMHQLVIGHLRSMWYKYLAVEWERVRPVLQKAVQAFQSVDLSAMDRKAAVDYVVGRPIKKDHWCEVFEDTQTLVFVPSAHVGPYTKMFEGDGKTWILFGARQPEDAAEIAPELSRAELLVRLNALADDTRLSIMKLVADQGELRSQDIMQVLDLSQSGASRHLQQLAASGFLHERRCNGAKCYALNSGRIDMTLQALNAFLSPVAVTGRAATQGDRFARLGERRTR